MIATLNQCVMTVGKGVEENNTDITVELSNFQLMFPLKIPWKHQKAKDSLMFRGIGRGYRIGTLA